MDSGHGSKHAEVIDEVLPYLRVYKDGTIERLVGNEVAPATFHPQTGVSSKDIVIIPETGVAARLYRPEIKPHDHHNKLPLVIYFHGGAFCISSAFDPTYHQSLNRLVAEANIIAMSIDYRRAPEFPLPAAYEDSWDVLQWVASQSIDGSHEPWMNDHVDFGRVFLAGDSAGANMVHHMALRVMKSTLTQKLQLQGIILIHPYFWGKKPIGSEISDPARKAMVDKWWSYVCPSEKGNDDPLINPFADGAPSLAGLACDSVIVCVAENDILRDRGRAYYEELVKSGWRGNAEIIETEGEDHVFHIFNPTCEKAQILIKRLAAFINQDKASYY